MATITKEQAELLRKYGFMWLKDQCTDRVHPECIESIIPTEDGFACIYSEKSVIAKSVVRLREENPIEWADDLIGTWICVNWEEINDTRKPGKTPASVG